jgi:hypothetical protein
MWRSFEYAARRAGKPVGLFDIVNMAVGRVLRRYKPTHKPHLRGMWLGRPRAGWKGRTDEQSTVSRVKLRGRETRASGLYSDLLKSLQ